MPTRIQRVPTDSGWDSVSDRSRSESPAPGREEMDRFKEAADHCRTKPTGKLDPSPHRVPRKT